MAPKAKSKCLRCPDEQNELNQHGDNLAKCQKEVKTNGNPYTLQDLWPTFTGTETTQHQDQAAAQAFIEEVRQSAFAASWCKETMEEAAELGFPASEANKKKKQPRKAAPTSAMSNLTINDAASTQTPKAGASDATPLLVSAAVPAVVPISGPATASTVAPARSTAMAASAPGPEAVSATIPAPTSASAGRAPKSTATVAQAATSGPTTLPPAGSAISTATTQQAQTAIQTLANQYIQGLAGRLAVIDDQNDQRRNGVPPSNQTQLSEQEKTRRQTGVVRKYGLRTAFTTLNQAERVETNHLRVQLPKALYVYDVEMIRVFTQNGPVHVKKSWDKLQIMHVIAPVAPNNPPNHNHAAVQNSLLAQRGRWASDGNMIWSTVPLFSPPGQQPQGAPSIISAPHQNLTYQNEMGNILTIHQVNITYRQTINLAGNVAGLFFDPAAITHRNSVPDILTRGLNAFFAKYVRDRSDPVAPNGTLSYTRVGSNKSFPSTGGFILDGRPPGHHSQPYPHTLRGNSGFFLSVRPGVQNMFVNMSTATSPFMEHGLTVQEYIQRCRAAPQNRSFQEMSAILKGAKVRITYTANNEAQAFPNPNSKMRFIKAVSLPVNQINVANRQPLVSPLRYPHHTVVRADQWYTSHVWRNAPEFPNPPITISAQHEYFVNVGKDQRTAANEVEWYPASRLIIEPWNSFTGRLTSNQTTEMIGRALLLPQPHRQRILGAGPEGGLSHFAFAGTLSGANQGGLAAANMSVNTAFESVPARFLNPPAIRYSRAREMQRTATDKQNAAATRPANITTANPASWNLNGVGFAATRFVENVLVLELNIVSPQNAYAAVLRDALRRHGLLQGTTCTTPTLSRTITPRKLDPHWERDFVNIFLSQAHKVQLGTGRIVLIVIPAKDFDDYACIKRAGDLQLGIQTICVTLNNARRLGSPNSSPNLQIASNIALKYNLKAGGDNHHFNDATLNRLKDGNTMRGAANTIVIGADVTHPGSSACTGTPSIAAVVGSIDNQFVKFPGSMRLQKSKKEDIVELADMVKERIVAWAKAHHNRLPTNILFYRDGVSESQYDILRRREMPQIQTAMNHALIELQGTGAVPVHPTAPPLPSQNPTAAQLRDNEEDFAATVESDANNTPMNLTYIVVGKRHHTRFYPAGAGTPQIANGNVRPGLVVDQVITHPYRMDFYLQSHNPIQGTGRSAHYVVLRNNMGLSADDIQTITHTFCYAYARATKGVSYCAPAYYADRLCDRGRSYLRRWLVNDRDAPVIPPKVPAHTWGQYMDASKNFVETSLEYRPLQATHPNRANPWHPALDNTMFYL